MALIKGETVILYDRKQTGTDGFNQPVFGEVAVEVANVLICPGNTGDITNENQLHGKMAEYELCIPKEDDHIWEDRKVEFFGQKWRTFGIPQQWIPENIPLVWNRRVKVERYG